MRAQTTEAETHKGAIVFSIDIICGCHFSGLHVWTITWHSLVFCL